MFRIGKLEWWDYQKVRKFKIKEMFTRFDTTHERDSDRWTDGQTDSIDRAVHSVARQQLLKTE